MRTPPLPHMYTCMHINPGRRPAAHTPFLRKHTHVRACSSAHRCLHLRAHTHTHVQIRAYTLSHTHKQTNTCKRKRAHTHSHTRTRTHTRKCKRTRTHMQVQAHTHTHTHTCMHKRMHAHSTPTCGPRPGLARSLQLSRCRCCLRTLPATLTPRQSSFYP